jgi:hypothetical protein
MAREAVSTVEIAVSQSITTAMAICEPRGDEGGVATKISASTAIENATVIADRMTALQTQFKFTNLNDLTAAMSYAAPQAILNVSLFC